MENKNKCKNYGKRPFPDVDGEKECIKCENCELIDECSKLTLKKLFPNTHII